MLVALILLQNGHANGESHMHQLKRWSILEVSQNTEEDSIMTTIPELAPIMQILLSQKANELARATGFIKRQRKITGAQFVQTLVFSQLAHPQASYRQIHQRAITLGETLTVQALDKRLQQVSSERFLAAMVDEALTKVIMGEHKTNILPNFEGIYLTDGSIVQVGEQKRKLGAMLEVQSGTLRLCLTAANRNDQILPSLLPQAEARQLHLRDLGFFKLATFQAWNTAGVHWLSRHKIQAKLYDAEDGHELSLAEFPRDQAFRRKVLVGSQRVAAYLVGQLSPPAALVKRQKRLHRQAQLEQAPISEQRLHFSAWTLYLTNIPDLSFEQAHTLARIRWQIELLFKLWKYQGALESSRSRLAQRNACLTYAKLLALIIQHWILIVTGWYSAQQSWVYNAGLLRDHISVFQWVLPDLTALIHFLQELSVYFSRALLLSKRRHHPLTFQLIASAFP
jgi:hypothetical protein